MSKVLTLAALLALTGCTVIIGKNSGSLEPRGSFWKCSDTSGTGAESSQEIGSGGSLDAQIPLVP